MATFRYIEDTNVVEVKHGKCLSKTLILYPMLNRFGDIDLIDGNGKLYYHGIRWCNICKCYVALDSFTRINDGNSILSDLNKKIDGWNVKSIKLVPLKFEKLVSFDNRNGYVERFNTFVDKVEIIKQVKKTYYLRNKTEISYHVFVIMDIEVLKSLGIKYETWYEPENSAHPVFDSHLKAYGFIKKYKNVYF